MTILHEPDGRLAALHARAAEKHGETFADALCEAVETSQRARENLRGRMPPIPSPAAIRGDVAKIRDAAAQLRATLRESSRHARAGFDGLATPLPRLESELSELCELAELLLAERAPSRRKDPMRETILAHLMNLFDQYSVAVTATASEIAPGSPTYTSLAVDAVMLALDVNAQTARAALRRAGTDLDTSEG